MATQQKVLFRGTVPTSSSSVYSVPSSTSAIITNIVIANTSGTEATVTLSIGGVEVLGSTKIVENTSLFADVKQVLNEFDAIELSASANGCTAHISGVEIS